MNGPRIVESINLWRPYEGWNKGQKRFEDVTLYKTYSVIKTFASFTNLFQGLNKMGRNHIHFAAGEPGENGVISGKSSGRMVVPLVSGIPVMVLVP